MRRAIVALTFGALCSGTVTLADRPSGEPASAASSLHCASGRQVMIQDVW